MTLIITLIVIGLAEGGIIYLINKIKNKEIEDLQVENHKLAGEIRQKERSMIEIKNHIERVNLTEEELKPIKKEIRNAKTDEEAILAIGNILKRNNSRIMPDND